MAQRLIPLRGGYRKLKSFEVAQLAYDVTVRFCARLRRMQFRRGSYDSKSCVTK